MPYLLGIHIRTALCGRAQLTALRGARLLLLPTPAQLRAGQIGLRGKRVPPRLLAAGGRLTINTLTRGAERRNPQGARRSPRPLKTLQKRKKRLELGQNVRQNNPNNIGGSGFFFDFEGPEQQKMYYNEKHVVFAKSSPGTCFCYEQVLFMLFHDASFFYRRPLHDRYTTVMPQM